MQNMNNAPRDDEMDLDFTEDLPTLRSDVPARQELSKIDVEILDISNLINQLEKDLQTPVEPSKGAALLAVLEKEKGRKMELLDKKFSAAIPVTTREKEVTFDEAMNANGGARVSSREEKSDRI